MAIKKDNLIVTAVAVIAAVASTPKTPAHLTTLEDLLSRLRIYANGKKEEQFKICIDGVTTPFPVIYNEEDGSWNYIGQIPGFDGSDEDKEAVREFYVNKLMNDPVAVQHGIEALKARAARLAAEKAAKANKELAVKTFKGELATKATTAVAAKALAGEAV